MGPLPQPLFPKVPATIKTPFQLKQLRNIRRMAQVLKYVSKAEPTKTFLLFLFIFPRRSDESDESGRDVSFDEAMQPLH